jgi:hypothetical protein
VARSEITWQTDLELNRLAGCEHGRERLHLFRRRRQILGYDLLLLIGLDWRYLVLLK